MLQSEAGSNSSNVDGRSRPSLDSSAVSTRQIGLGSARSNKRRRIGGLEHMESMDAFEDGPATFEELFQAPATAWKRMMEQDPAVTVMYEENLRSVAKRGVELISMYSGKGTAETCGIHIGSLMKNMNMCESKSLPIWTASACDLGPLQQKVLCNMQDECGRDLDHCVFGDIRRRVVPNALAQLSSLLPESKMSKGQKAECYEAHWQYIVDNLASIFDTAQCDHCYKHARLCPIFSTCHPKKNGGGGAVPLKGVLAGSSCDDFATYGNCERMGGEKMEIFNLFCAEILCRQPDFVIHEITACTPETLLLDKLGHTYKQVSGIIDPLTLGFPTKRPRRYTTLRHKHRHTMHGDWQDLVDTLRVSTVMYGADLMVASSEQRAESYWKLANQKGNYKSDPDSDEPPPLDWALTPNELSRIDAHSKQNDGRADPRGRCLADIEQNPKFCMASPFVPTLVTHGKIMELKSGTMATGLEHLAFQGEPVFSARDSSYPMCIKPEVLEELSEKELKHLAGMSFHLNVISAIMLWALCNMGPIVSGADFSEPEPESSEWHFADDIE